MPSATSIATCNLPTVAADYNIHITETPRFRNDENLFSLSKNIAFSAQLISQCLVVVKRPSDKCWHTVQPVSVTAGV